MEEKLKPCPHCHDGGKPAHHKYKGVKCHKCGAWGPQTDDLEPVGWNTRALCPDTIEACAKVADTVETYMSGSSYAATAGEIAAAIRQLGETGE